MLLHLRPQLLPQIVVKFTEDGQLIHYAIFLLPPRKIRNIIMQFMTSMNVGKNGRSENMYSILFILLMIFSEVFIYLESAL